MDKIQQQDLKRFMEAPLLSAIDRCLAELRTPLTSVQGNASLIRIFTDRAECLTLARSILQYNTVINQHYLNEEFLDLRRMLIARFPHLNYDHSYDDIGPPLGKWEDSLATMAQSIAQKLREAGMGILNTVEQLQTACESNTNPDLFTITLTIRERMDSFLVHVSLLEDVLVERIRRECVE